MLKDPKKQKKHRSFSKTVFYKVFTPTLRHITSKGKAFNSLVKRRSLADFLKNPSQIRGVLLLSHYTIERAKLF